MRDLSIVILAGGNGKRMYSPLPKVLHKVGGLTLLEHVVATAKCLNPTKMYVVYGKHGQQICEQLSHVSVTWVEQPEQLGTGHALLQAIPHIPDNHRVLVLYGDVPLISSSTLESLLEAMQTTAQGLGVLVANFAEPMGFGRIIRDASGNIIAIVEQKDATAEQLLIHEINTGIMTGTAQQFKKWLPQLSPENSQAEYYLTEVVSLAVQEKIPVIGVRAKCATEVSGVNTRLELLNLERFYQNQLARSLVNQGVNLFDTNRFDCRGKLSVEEGVTIDIDVVFEGEVTIGQGSVIGPYCFIRNVVIGKNVIIESHSVIDGAHIKDNCKIGPFTRIRPGTHLDNNVHIGNFVELKKTHMGENSKASHLSYLGDSEIGRAVNIGAGTITCNYDGKNKNRTIIADEAFIGSGTELVAPVSIGKGAYIGAGSTITRDAPEEELTISRAKQCTIKGWKKKRK